MKSIFDKVSDKCSKYTTNAYSTSFSLGIYLLHKSIRKPIYAIYGFVRFADEIVDTFHDYDKERLLQKFRNDTVEALEDKISLNPILNSFQEAVHQYNIEWDLINTFLESMEMDLNKHKYNQLGYEKYILGSAEVVGLMCLRVFTNGDHQQYESLKPAAQKLGSAFQKVNFLRDIHADFAELGRTYFPQIDLNNFSKADKLAIEAEIAEEFDEALIGIQNLPKTSRLGVYVAFIYYKNLLSRIKSVPVERIMEERVRVSNPKKISLMFNSYLRNQFNLF